jgi:Lon protease-like protein
MRLPMFPLGNVVLPGEVFPLHVFEPRYRQLVLDCLAMTDRRPEFGVALIERGSEVGGGDDRTSVGTVARIARVDPLDNGRFALVTVGTRRVSVLEWLPDDPYPIADVEDWPDTAVDEPEEMRSVIDALSTRVGEVQRLAQEVARASKQRSAVPSASSRKLSDDPAMATYQLVTRSPVGPADRYRLLSAPSVAIRLETFAEVLDDVEAMLKFRLETSG